MTATPDPASVPLTGVALIDGLVQSSVWQLDAARTQEVTNTKKYQDQQVAANEDYSKQVVDFKTRREETVSKLDDNQRKLDESSKEVATIKATKDKEIDGLHQKIAKLDQQHVRLQLAVLPRRRGPWPRRAHDVLAVELFGDDALQALLIAGDVGGEARQHRLGRRLLGPSGHRQRDDGDERGRGPLHGHQL